MTQLKSRGILSLLMALMLMACGPKSNEELFQQAEAVVNDHPDSTLTLLKIIRPHIRSEAEWYRGALLWTQALDKAFVPHTSDSLINRVVAYYDTHGDDHQKALAYYYKGRVNHDLGKLKVATDAYLAAYDYVKKINDPDLAFRIITQVGTLYAHQGLELQASDAYQKGFDIATMAKDSSNMAFSYAYLGRIEGVKKNWEQAAIFYRTGLRIAEQIKDYHAVELCIQELIGVYTSGDKVDEALSMVDSLKFYNRMSGVPSNGSVNLVLGDLYRSLNQVDSAYFYLYQAIEAESIYTRRSAYHALYYLSERLGELKDAIYFNERYKACQKEIEEMGPSPEIQAIKDSYDWKERETVWSNALGWAGCAGIVLVLILLALLGLYVKEREKGKALGQSLEVERLKREEVEMEKRKMEAEKEKEKEKQKPDPDSLEENPFMRDYWAKKTSPRAFLNELYEHPRYVREGELVVVAYVLRKVRPALFGKMRKENPALTDDDIVFCGLVGEGFTEKKLATIYAISPEGVSKRKQRLKERFSAPLPRGNWLINYLKNL